MKIQAQGRLMALMKRTFLIGIVGVMLTILPVQAQNALTLLDIEAGVRALGMGGAFVAVADDETTAFVNPAGLAGLRAMAFEFNAENRFSRATYGGLTFAGRNFGVGALFLNISDVVGRNDEGKLTQNFGYTSMAGYFSAGATLRDLSLSFLRTPPLDNIAVGLRAQLYRVNFMPPQGETFGLTLSPAGLFTFPFGGESKLRIGLLVENLVPIGLTYGTGHDEPWRIGGRLGASLELQGNITLAAEIESTGIFHLGGEFRFTNLNTPEVSGLAVRAGAIILRGGPMITFGVGAKVGTYELNYAFTGHPDLPPSHRLSFTARFANQSLICLFTGFDEVGVCDP
jgi:hypothetical protein